MFIKKNLLAVALVAGLGLAGAAAAYTLNTNNDNLAEKVATSDITSATYVYTMTEAVQFKIDPTDFIVGRTTGFNVRFELDNGAVFGPSAGTINTSPGAPGSALPAGWTVSLLAGGAGQAFAVYGVVPPSTTPVPGIQPGTLFTLTGTQLTNLTSLQTSGGTITATSRYIDPVGASEISRPSPTTPLLTSGNPVSLACNANAGDVNARIDVGQDATHASKTFFSSTGQIALLDKAYINLGSVNVTKDPTFASFSYNGTDSFTSVVSGNFGAFFAAGNSLTLSTSATCASAITATTGYNPATQQATFTYTGTNASFGANGGTLYLCGRVANGNATVIDASSVSVRTTFNRTGTPAVTGNACSLLPLQYNGSVVRVYNVNPAGNTTAQSFVRIINQSGTPGRVTIKGIDDAGNIRGPLSLNLGALKSVQLNSDDLQNGNAAKGLTGSLGAGTGKWRLFVTGEFAGMAVQSLNRNNTDGTVTNLTDADSRGEQLLNDTFEGFTPPSP